MYGDFHVNAAPPNVGVSELYSEDRIIPVYIIEQIIHTETNIYHQKIFIEICSEFFRRMIVLF